MGRDRPTRRRILTSLGGIGAFSAASGAGTQAVLTDTEQFSGQLTAGQVALQVDCERCSTTDDSVEIDFDDLSPGAESSTRIRVSVPEQSNPVRLWLRTACPPVGDPLGEALETRLSVLRDCDPDDRTFLTELDGEWVSLSELRRTLSDGTRIEGRDGRCIENETLCLDFEYRLPETATWTVETTTDLRFELFGQQCRHVPESEVDSDHGPYADTDCPDLDCPSCTELGKVEVQGNQLVPDNAYEFEELDQYKLEILSVTNKDDGTAQETVCASFRLLKNGVESDAPPICKATVAGGGQTVSYEIEPPLTRTRGELCAPTKQTGPTDGQRPAISNITVFVCPNHREADDV